MKAILGALGFCFGLCSASCALQPASAEEVSGGEPEVAAVSSEALVGGWAFGPYEIRGSATSGASRSLKPIATHLCLLTRVQGNLGPTGDGRASARVLEQGGYWKLAVSTNLEASAYCVLRSDFESASAGTQLSDEVTARPNAEAPTWGGYAFTFLTGIEGMQFQTAAGIEAVAPASIAELGQIRSDGPRLTAFGRAFAVGAGDSEHKRVLAKTKDFYLPRPSAETPEILERPRVLAMWPTSRSVCGFSKIWGKAAFRGSRLSIEPNADLAKLEVWALTSNSNTFSGSARCYDRKETK